jgi:hypothetical protein
MVKNLHFSYDEGLRKDETLETLAKMSLDTCLKPIAEEINNKNASVHVMFLKHGQRLLFLRGADVELHLKYRERIDQLRINYEPELMSYFF